ncbi:hypothetical protein HGM15179_020934 [Zosterops borbonicus]|uniref:Integrase-type domain-containing protein n=1 Tax=Zosterops borbonicus TaxID=364589 RepID=A0A8K1FTQ3_9PASS|nr:hypothetical protein HGM15179_020934 [Zosterops borbonicus]
MFEHLLQGNASLQISLDSYRGQISVHAPSHKLFNEEFHLIPHEKRSRKPLKALTVFTDASGASHKSVMTWRNPQTQHWEADVEFVEGSPQVAELAAVAKLSHQQYHQNVPGLIRQFRLTWSQTRAIVVTCPNCQLQAIPSMGIGVNPWGLGSCEVWQTDITHIPSFGRLKYVHVSIDTYSEKTYLTLNPVMNPIQVVTVLMLNGRVTAWIIPQLRQNVWVTLAQTLQQENICLSTAAAENPMSACLVGIPLQAGEFPAGLDTYRSNEIPESRTPRPHKEHQQQAVGIMNLLEEWLQSLPKAKPKRVAVSLFLLWVTSSKALGELGHLECWVVKQANLTSTTISSLLEDKEIARQATLQNRAAINFLLLLHGHECQEFEGLCCLNLTSKAPDIRAALRSMKSLIGQVKQESEDWVKELFKGWRVTGWWTSIVKTILLFLFILFLVTIAFGILRHLVFKAIHGLILSTSEVNHVKLADLKQSDFPTNRKWWESSHPLSK